ncbi:MAG: HAD family hydrolase [Clostridia bacterium]|nr:HAD family hydrolase [Clostridia bacterium]
MKYKLIVSDFDDTMVDDAQVVSETTIQAIRDYESRGGKFVFCTGRMISAILPHAKKLGLKGEIIGYQGAVVADIESGNFLVEHAIPYEKAMKVGEYLEKRGLYYHVYEDDTFVIKEENAFSQGYRYFTFKEPKIVGKNLTEYMAEKRLSPTKILIINEPSKIPAILQEMQEQFGDILLVNSSKRFIVEIVPLDIDKGSAVKELAERLGISLDEVITVGDGLNDIPMLSCGAFGIAVENANPKAKAVANVIAPSCTEEPIKWIIDKYTFD